MSIQYGEDSCDAIKERRFLKGKRFRDHKVAGSVELKLRKCFFVLLFVLTTANEVIFVCNTSCLEVVCVCNALRV